MSHNDSNSAGAGPNGPRSLGDAYEADGSRNAGNDQEPGFTGLTPQGPDHSTGGNDEPSWADATLQGRYRSTGGKKEPEWADAPPPTTDEALSSAARYGESPSTRAAQLSPPYVDASPPHAASPGPFGSDASIAPSGSGTTHTQPLPTYESRDAYGAPAASPSWAAGQGWSPQPPAASQGGQPSYGWVPATWEWAPVNEAYPGQAPHPPSGAATYLGGAPVPPYGMTQPGYSGPGAPTSYGPQALGRPQMPPPGSYDPVTGEPLSDKSKVVAAVLQFFLGAFGVGRFYIGDNRTGGVQLGLCVLGIVTSFILIGIPLVLASGLWALIDSVLMLTGAVRDPYGRRLS